MKKYIQRGSIIFLVLLLIPMCSTSVIKPDEIGVRRSLFGGVTEHDFGQGRMFDLPILHTVYRLPRSVQYQHFLESQGAALNLRTRDNNLIDVDVSIVYQIKQNQGYKIIEEGLQESYHQKVHSISKGFLNEKLAQLSNQDFLITEKRLEFAADAIKIINEDLEQYHIEVIEGGVVVRAVRFKGAYEEKLQDKQLFQVKAKLDEAKRLESEAITLTDTKQKEIDKDVKIETEDWNNKIEKERSIFEIQIAEINAEALKYDKEKRANADADCSKAKAEAGLAEVKAEALGKRLEADALATPAGKIYSAIIAVQNFKLGNDIALNSYDSSFLSTFSSMKAWREFFLGQTGDEAP